MNEQEFILLMEEYLEGSLTPQGRAALKAEVLKNPVRRKLFENQARQHIRLHAQSSRIDFTETQRIAVMVMDIVEKQKEPSVFMELIRQKTFRERASLILQGLKAAPGTLAHRTAKAELVRIFGPVSLSVAVNVAALLLLLFWVPYVLPPPPDQEGSEEKGAVIINLGEPDLNQPDPSDSTPPPEITTPSGRSSEPPMAPTDLTLPPLGGGAPGPGDDSPRPPLERPGDGTSSGEPLSAPLSLRHVPGGFLPSSHGNRETTLRAAILTEQKAQKTEAAVGKSLQWLKAHQAADGSWPGQEPTAMTGLALLAYLAHGETPSSPEFGDTVTRGLRSLLKRQESTGAFSKNVYAHAIATYALAEAYTMTRIMDLKPPLEKAARVIINGQQSAGGFDYNYLKGQRFDTSVTGWQIQALKAARTAIPDLDGLEEALTRSTRFLLSDALARDGSGFVYEGKDGVAPVGGGRLSMTGVGTLCLQMLGKNTSPPVKSGLKILQNAELEWPAAGKANVYAGYYVSQAKFQSGNQADWMHWNLHMQRVLLSKQKQDGHWEQGDYDNGSHVYTTTLCALMLEVYYRYLPSYAQRPEPEPVKKIASGDVSIDIK
ncbi:MAG: prenyltransferase/squalene oxidase repeat-containing protein [bacterium]